MQNEPYFDLHTARTALEWLKRKLKELMSLTKDERSAMEVYDLDTADSLERKMQDVLQEIRDKGIIFRDPSSDLFDFPCMINDMPAYFCWKSNEPEIEYWHYVDEGFAGRKKITGNENIMSYL